MERVGIMDLNTWLTNVNSALEKFGQTLGTTGNILMSIAAIIFVTWHVIQGYKAAKDEKFTDLIKHAILAVIGVILAVVGVSGFLTAAQTVNKGDGNSKINSIMGGTTVPPASIKPFIMSLLP